MNQMVWIYRSDPSSYNPVVDDPYSVSETNDLYHQRIVPTSRGDTSSLDLNFISKQK